MAVKNSKSTSKSASSMAELMARFSSRVKPLKKGDIVEGTVKKLTPKEIILDIGGKSDALVLEFDKQNVQNLLRILHLGDRVKASVLSAESEAGFPVVSLRRTLDHLIFSKLEEKLRSKETIEIEAVEATRGGFFVQTQEGIKGFLPNSQVLDESNVLGRSLQAKIIDLDRSRKRVIFSEKANVYLVDIPEIEKLVKKDQVVEIRISNVANHGIYGVISPKKDTLIEGFIHISEVSYSRVDDLQSRFKKQDVIKAQVVGVDGENRRVNLSIKRMEKISFDKVKLKYKKDQKVTGIIKEVKRSGIVIQLEEGITGFISTTKISQDVTYKELDQIEALVEDFDDRKGVFVLTPVLKAKPIGYR